MISGALNWSAIVAAGVFVFSQIFDVARKYWGERRERSNLARAISAEIKVLIKTSGESASPERLRNFLESTDIRTINAFSFVSSRPNIYLNNIEKIGQFPPQLVEDIVTLYSHFEILSGMITHFKSTEFIESDDRVHETMKQLCIRSGESAHILAPTVLAGLRGYYRGTS